MGRVAVYYEAAVVIISLTMLGQIIELKARRKPLRRSKALLGLALSDRPPHQRGWQRRGCR